MTGPPPQGGEGVFVQFLRGPITGNDDSNRWLAEVETFMIDRVMSLALVGMDSLRRRRAGAGRITSDGWTLFRCGWIVAGLLFTLAPALAISSPDRDRERLATAIERAGAYLNAAVGPDGQFVYRRWPDGGESKQGDRYNVLRHAGTLYVLAIYDRSWRTDPAQRAALRRAGGFLWDCCPAPPPHRPDLLAVWSPPELEGPNKPLQAKLGGAGLGLAALLELEKVEPDFTPLEDLRRLGRFILYLQKSNGDFYAKYIPSRGGRRDNWVSLYYPGEAALGLALLYERDPDPAWLRGAAAAIAYLARQRAGQMDIPADHWALLATARLWPLLDGPVDLPLSRALALHHARLIVLAMLQEQDRVTGDPRLNGAFTADGRPTPTATRLEGLLAALTFLPHEDDGLRARVEVAAHRGVGFLLCAQIQSGPLIGGWPRVTPGREGKTARAGDEAVRIDYVQHALGALLQYHALFAR